MRSYLAWVLLLLTIVPVKAQRRPIDSTQWPFPQNIEINYSALVSIREQGGQEFQNGQSKYWDTTYPSNIGPLGVSFSFRQVDSVVSNNWYLSFGIYAQLRMSIDSTNHRVLSLSYGDQNVGSNNSFSISNLIYSKNFFGLPDNDIRRRSVWASYHSKVAQSMYSDEKTSCCMKAISVFGTALVDAIHPPDTVSFLFSTLRTIDSTLVLHNVSTLPLIINRIQFFGDTEFRLEDTASRVIAAGDSSFLKIHFAPTNTQTFSGMLEIGTDEDVSQYSITVIGKPLSQRVVQSSPRNTPSLRVYPNPTTQSAAITFTPEAAGHAEMSVVNMLGVEVARLFSGEVDSSEHSFTWDTGKMPVPLGMYECVVRLNGRVQTLPIVVQH